MFMIPVFYCLCNIFGPNFTNGLTQYYEFIAEMDRFQIECNYCHRRGCCIRHAYYQRNYLLKPEALDPVPISILRMKCKECGTTHAILPEEIVAYAQFSAVFMFLVLYQYYLREKTVEAICAEFGIAPPALYRWKKTFEHHKDIYFGVLESGKHSALCALKKLRTLPSYARDFAAMFLRRTERLPMQRHPSASNICRPVFADFVS